NYQTQHTAPSGGGMSAEDLPNYQDTLTRAEGLTEHLMEQLRMTGLTPEEERLGALIIGNLNRGGYPGMDPQAEPPRPALTEDVEARAVLATSAEEDAAQTAEKALKAATKAAAVARAARGEADPLVSLALEAGVSAASADKVLHVIQRFEPIGCGARDLRECLLGQARWYLAAAEGKGDPDA